MKKYILVTLVIAGFILNSCKPNFKHLQKEENNYHITTESQLQNKEYAKRIENIYDSGIEGNFTGKADINIYFKIFKQPKKEKAAILISSGRTEAAIKYKELIFDLYNNGYSIYIHDHRGQGLSGRMTEDHDMGYIDDFQFYVDDMKYFYDNYLKPKEHKKIFLLAHSMGGAVGLTYLEQNTTDFNAAAFSSPMLGLTPPICGAVKLLIGTEPKYALGETKYNDDKVAFEENNLTSSKIRYARLIKAFDKVPKAKLGGATYQWINRSCNQFEYLFNNLDKIQTPIILFSAQNDAIIDVRAHQRFVEKAKSLNKEGRAYIVENAQHELFIEKDEQRIESINEILNFYNDH
ncbi:MAG: hypothetical protein DRJ07_00640 [Bacteroidetes bacterium]|nr:MAG: hypothetical protein DRJ07_00640 [Bacteroidota bacterium]